MTCSRTALLAAVLACGLASACKHADDPLAPFRQQCKDLQTQGQLRAGLSIDECASSLKTAADANDPAKRANELAQRMQALVQQGAAKGGPAQDELRAAIAEVQALGKPAAPVLQSRMEASHDPDLRISYARALVGICFEDCEKQKFDCIAPALLEGLTPDKPAEVRQISVQGLSRCTGKSYGDDDAAWTHWWASVKTH